MILTKEYSFFQACIDVDHIYNFMILTKEYSFFQACIDVDHMQTINVQG
jgi:hypothetical protein